MFIGNKNIFKGDDRLTPHCTKPWFAHIDALQVVSPVVPGLTPEDQCDAGASMGMAQTMA